MITVAREAAEDSFAPQKTRGLVDHDSRNSLLGSRGAGGDSKPTRP